jgi:hypothetical protein
MAKRKYIHHGSLRDKKADLGSNATACATINHSLNDGQTIELSITAATTLNITDVWDGARAVLSVSATSAALTLQVNGTAVDAVSCSSFCNCATNIIYLDIVDDAADVHPAYYRKI